MAVKRQFAVQSLSAILVLNAILLGVIYALAGDGLQPDNQVLLFIAAGVVITLVLWVIISSLGRRLIGLAEPPQPQQAIPEVPARSMAERVRPVERTLSAEAGAVQMLAILQRQSRLLDFLQEDLSLYEDAQIGAAVRTIHEGAKQALAEHAKIEPIFGESEGSDVTVQAGFDTHAIRLTGNVVGEPPFRGTLRHRGWRVASLDLPKQGQEQEMVVAAAEIEVNA